MIKIKTSVVFDHLENSKKRITVEQGGARSSKTYNILIWEIVDLLRTSTPQILSIFRETRSAVKCTVFRDFVEIMERLELYNEKKYLNKTNLEYRLNNHLIEFCGLDDEQKVRGRKRHRLFFNEFNECSKAKWKQLLLRTSGKIVVDFNPSDSQHFVFSDIITRDDCDFYQTSYGDNPFLEHSLVKEIERLEKEDNYLWRVFGLGEKGVRKNIIFPKYNIIDDDLFGLQAGTVMRGMDFGFNDPTTLIQVKIDTNYLKIFIKEEIYERYLSPNKLIEKLEDENIDKKIEIVADNARPDLIQEIYDEGWNIHACEKGADSIYQGIMSLKKYKLFITKSSINVKKELDNYKWKEDKNGNVLDEPVDAFNHTIDTLRYILKRKNNDLYFAVV